MASIYRVMPGLLNRLALNFGIHSRELPITIGKEAQAYRLFGLFLALKISLPIIFRDGIHWPLSTPSFLCLSVLLVFFSWRATKSHVQLVDNLILWSASLLSLFEIWQSWPFTINHNVLEFGIMLLMCCHPRAGEVIARITIVDMIKILMMSVWFYSGIHKLFDGYYWNAEFFALEALSNNTVLGHHLNQIIQLFSWSNEQSHLSCCVHGILPFNELQIAVLLILSWMTLSAEILLPISLLIPKFRSIGIVLLFLCQAFITYFSGEVDFAFSAFAILFLFVPRLAPFAYPGLALLFLLVQPWP